MIENKKKLKDVLAKDFRRQGMAHPVLASLTYGEHAVVWKYIKTLRYVEFFDYKRKNTSFLLKLLYSLAYYRKLLSLRKQSLKTGIFISPNTCGAGLLLPHPGSIRISGIVRMGENCTILPSVLFGRRRPEATGNIVVGDDCYFGAGSTIIGPLTIGNNVTIGAGAVVTKDMPSNSVVGGIPAKVISTK
ncbi:serine acetyltransferase [Fibrobacter sp.]